MLTFFKKSNVWRSKLPSNDLATSNQRDRVLALLAKADAARDFCNWAVAADAYEAVLALRPDDAPIWVQLGNTSKEANDFVRAQFAYTRALDLRPNDSDTHLQFGHLHKRAGNKAAALASYTQANRLDPANENAFAEIQILQEESQPVPTATPIFPQAQVAPHQRNRIPRKLSFNARVLVTKSALQKLLRFDLTSSSRSSLDQARPAILQAVTALERIIQGDITEPPTLVKTPTTVVFDVSDLIQYFRHHRLPTGIQRVQIEVISVALLRANGHDDVRVCCFTETRNYWREVPPETFLELCEMSLVDGDWTAPEWRELMEDLDDILGQTDDFRFDEGAFLVNIGTSWWLQNYFLQVREAKQQSNIRYAPFVHDMIPIMTPEYCVEGLVRDFIGWAQGVFAHADFFFVNSEAARADLIKIGKQLGYNVSPDRIKTVRLDADYRKPDLKPMNGVGILKPHRLMAGEYVLLVSTIEARKNHVAVFDAWLQLCKTHGDEVVPKLVCVGFRGWLNEAVLANSQLASVCVKKW